jgi:subtilisin-like proprotein convertase family protein
MVVPDGNASGLALQANLTGMTGIITNLTLTLDISGGYNGDLYAYLAGPHGGFAVLLNRVGATGGDGFGYGDTGFNLTFDDSASYNNIHFYQNLSYDLNGSGQLTGTWASDGRAIGPQSDPSAFDTTQPTSLLSSFNGTDPNGTWTLFLADLSSGEQSTVLDWGLNIQAVPEPSVCGLLGIGLLLAAQKRIRRSK